MTKLFKSDAFSIGLALFAMFFGAGNIVYPLAIGQYAGDKNLLATVGFLLTAGLMPIAGVIAMILYDGNYKDFFGRLGKIPGLLLALVTISLLGPLGSTPRCIALCYTTLNGTFIDMSPMLFSSISCSLVFVLTMRKNQILKILGYFLTPILLASLATIIVMGLYTAPEPQSIDHAHSHLFMHGLKQGYNTMDLLAAFFFSSTILTILRNRFSTKNSDYLKTALHASLIGAFCLSLVYIGFTYLSSYHAHEMSVSSPDELLGGITYKIAGEYGGLLVSIAIVFACLTTVIALISSFTDFFQKEILKEKISYEATLAGSLFITFIMASFDFSSISAFLSPILIISYPGLIVLTFLNIAHKLKGVEVVKTPVFITFGLSALLYWMG